MQVNEGWLSMKGIKKSNIANFVCLEMSTYNYFKSKNYFIYGVDNFNDVCFVDFIRQYPTNQPFFVQYKNRAYMAIEFTERSIKENGILKRRFISHEIIEFFVGKAYLKSSYLLANLSSLLSDAQLYTKIKIGKPELRNMSKENQSKEKLQNKNKSLVKDSKKIKENQRKKSNIRYITNKQDFDEVKCNDLNKNYIPNKIFTGNKSLYLFITEDIVGKIEIIETVNSINKHKNHTYDKNGVVKKFVYKNDEYFNIIELHVFYCEKCNVYFDYLESYKNQLCNANVKTSDMIVSHFNSNGTPFYFDTHTDWAQES